MKVVGGALVLALLMPFAVVVALIGLTAGAIWGTFINGFRQGYEVMK